MKQPYARMLEAAALHVLNVTSKELVERASSALRARKPLGKRLADVEERLKKLEDRPK